MRGFTIIELMIAMFVGSIVLGGTYKAFQNQRIVYKQQEIRTAMNNDLRLATDFMQRYIRNAGIRGDGQTYSAPLPGVLKSGNNLMIYSDFNMDGSIDSTPNLTGPSETVIFQFDDSNANNGKLKYCPGSTANCALLLNHIDVSSYDMTVDSSGEFVDITMSLKKKNPQLDTDIVIPAQTIRVFIPNQGFQ